VVRFPRCDLCFSSFGCRPLGYSPAQCQKNLFASGQILPACQYAAFSGRLPFMKTMKKLVWLLPLLIMLGTIFVAVEIKGSPPTDEITINYGHLVDTKGRSYSVQLVLHPGGSVTWRDLTHHIR